MTHQNATILARRDWGGRSVALAIGFLALAYLCLMQNYRAYDIDNPWFLSFSYNSCNLHVERDTYLGVHFPFGMDGTHLFGKLAAFNQCAVLNRIGWMPSWAMLLSAMAVLLALALWAMALHKLHYSRRFVTVFLLVLGLSEPFVSMATKARYEYFSFLLMSLAIYLAVSGFEFAGLLLAFIAVETQPAAVAAPIVLILLLSLLRKWRTRQIVQIAIAAMIACGLYILLHPAAITQMLHGGAGAGSPPSNANMHRGGFAAAYFLERKRHIPELFLFVISLVACWRKRNQFEIKWPLWTSGALIGLSVALVHGNVAYMVFLYPFLVLATLKAFESRTVTFIAAGMVFCCVIQYAYLTRMNLNEGWRVSDVRAMSQAIDLAKAETRKADPHIYGDYTVWFAHPRYFEAAAPLTQADVAKADIYLCFDRPLMPPGWVSPDVPTCADLKSQTTLADSSTLLVRNHLLHVMIHPN